MIGPFNFDIDSQNLVMAHSHVYDVPLHVDLYLNNCWNNNVACKMSLVI